MQRDGGDPYEVPVRLNGSRLQIDVQVIGTQVAGVLIVEINDLPILNLYGVYVTGDKVRYRI
jgi:hypothetical protein